MRDFFHPSAFPILITYEGELTQPWPDFHFITLCHPTSSKSDMKGCVTTPYFILISLLFWQLIRVRKDLFF